DEAIGVGIEAGVGTLVLYHFSGRYNWSEIRAAVVQTATRRKAQLPIWCLFRDRLLPVWPAEESRASQNESARRQRAHVASRRVWTGQSKSTISLDAAAQNVAAHSAAGQKETSHKKASRTDAGESVTPHKPSLSSSMDRPA
ncbi:MAG: hypothetical protein JWN98_613, partial [Abditibacteriota bacterium]|nr:hypothetical protein [Abditibacteriota bacterium]